MTDSLLRVESIVGMRAGKYAIVSGVVVISCPKCGFQQTVECPIHVDGTMTEEMECHNEFCGYRGRVRLSRWE